MRWGLAEADVVIGSVLLPGKRAPKLMQTADLQLMEPGTVLVDLAIDQGGGRNKRAHNARCAHLYRERQAHYCVTNMPDALPHTATLALTEAFAA